MMRASRRPPCRPDLTKYCDAPLLLSSVQAQRTMNADISVHPPHISVGLFHLGKLSISHFEQGTARASQVLHVCLEPLQNGKETVFSLAFRLPPLGGLPFFLQLSFQAEDLGFEAVDLVPAVGVNVDWLPVGIWCWLLRRCRDMVAAKGRHWRWCRSTSRTPTRRPLHRLWRAENAVDLVHPFCRDVPCSMRVPFTQHAAGQLSQLGTSLFPRHRFLGQSLA